MKRKIITLAIVAVAFIAWHTAAHAQWVQTNTPIGLDIRSLGVNGTTLFAGSDIRPSVYRSTNNGNYWVPVNNGLPDTSVYGSSWGVSAIVVLGQSLFIGTLGNGVYRSTNNGDLWLPANNGLKDSSVQALTVMGTTLFAGTNYGGVYRSTDNGGSWAQVNSGLTDTNVQALAVIGTILFAGTRDSGVFHSTNNGSTWAQANNGITGFTIYSLMGKGTSVFAGTDGYGEFRSTNSGATWTPVDSGLVQSEYLASIVAINSTLYAASSYGNIYRSTNNGTIWNQVAAVYDNNGVTLAGISTTLFAGVTGPTPLVGGVFRSTDGGSTWADANAGISNIAIINFITSGNTLFAAMAYDYGSNHGGLYNTTDNGDTWGEVLDQHGFPDAYYGALAATGAFMFAGGNEFVTPQWSTNGGITWDSSTLGGISDLVTAGNFIYAADGSVYRSADNGKSWAQLDYGLVDTNAYRLVAIGTTLLTGTLGSGMSRSTVSGGIWSPANIGMTDTNIYALAMIGSTVFAGTDGGVYRSRDTGSTWTKVNNGLPNGTVYTFAVYGTTLFTIAGTSVFKSINEGDLWAPMNNGLTDTTIYKLARTGTTLFAAANTAIYRYDLSGTNAVAEPLPVSPKMFLSVQPNPAHDNILVRYNTFSANAEIELFNTLGEQVMSEYVSAAGETILNISSLPAGMYLLALRSNNATKTQPVMVVR